MDHASRPGTKCKWICFQNFVTGTEYAVDVMQVKKIMRGPYAGTHGSFYLVDEWLITGKAPPSPF
jgi:hypothetical protein